ncbi:hypothetical protein EB796_024656 [Bugula neritina]|uniref:Glycosyltransferase 2-like domain-containing protein n=1 Tax=Bugula neritina TaxID=10212 RepID=A0A7J7IT94_BUGNE|nr:hypothetical protein EB796_024656 [Bugula neritina]
MAVIRVNRNTKTVVRVLVGAGAFWLLVSIFFIKSSSDDNRPPQLRRPRADLEQFKPAQPSKKFEFPPPSTEASGKSGGLFQSEPDRNIIPPPLHIQLKKPNVNPNAPGEMGKAVDINKDDLSPEERKKYDEGFHANAFNEYASNMISVHRQLPDIRDPECSEIKYAKNLPDTSVILCFHNEAWSVLLRSVHSIIDRSDPKLLKEIILVDDFSDKPHLGEKLKKYMDDLKIVTIVRMSQREGLIRARLAGARAASGTVLTFLDSHIECTEGKQIIAIIYSLWLLLRVFCVFFMCVAPIHSPTMAGVYSP